VSSVVTYQDNLRSLIEQIKPRFILKGNEFQNSDFPELGLLQSYGGELIFGSGSQYFSAEDEIRMNHQSGVLKKSRVSDYLERNGISTNELLTFTNSFSKKKILVLGDSIVDEIVMCHPLGMSQEEPSVVVTPIDSMKFIGGAAIVASHCASMGAKTSFISVRGEDAAGEWLDHELSKAGVEVSFYIDEHRKTTLKKRFRSGRQTLFRLTDVTTRSVKSNLKREILDQIRSQIKDLDAIILSDFSYGFFDKNFAQSIIKTASEKNIIIAADSQTSSQVGDLSRFSGVTMVTPTEKEARLELKDEESGLVQISEKLSEELNCQYVLLKLGSDGLLLYGRGPDGTILRTDRIEALNDSPSDVSGAGDSLLACATLALTVSDEMYTAAMLGSIASAIQVSRIGNIPLSIEELQNEIINI
jgi:rfaE bifunctional protein kinase chain/domain